MRYLAKLGVGYASIAIAAPGLTTITAASAVPSTLPSCAQKVIRAPIATDPLKSSLAGGNLNVVRSPKQSASKDVVIATPLPTDDSKPLPSARIDPQNRMRTMVIINSPKAAPAGSELLHGKFLHVEVIRTPSSFEARCIQ